MTKLLTQSEQPSVPDSAWLLLEEAHSKFPVLADVEAARVKLARKFNRQLPKAVEVDLAWKAHARHHRRWQQSRERAP